MADEQTFELSNFRRGDVIEDWPLGGGKRGNCCFTHESNNRGQRMARTTTGKPKRSVYYKMVCLVDGTDDKTHFIGLTPSGTHLAVMSCDMKHSDFAVFPGDPNFDEYLAQLGAVAK